MDISLPLQGKGTGLSPFSNFSEKIIRAPSLKKLFHALALQPLLDPKAEKEQTNRFLTAPGQKVPFQVILPEARVDLLLRSGPPAGRVEERVSRRTFHRLSISTRRRQTAGIA